MQEQHVVLPLGGLPLQLVCISDASIAIVKSQNFTTIIEDNASFSNESFTIAGVEYAYNKKIYYKQVAGVLEWLQQQKLIAPQIQ